MTKRGNFSPPKLPITLKKIGKHSEWYTSVIPATLEKNDGSSPARQTNKHVYNPSYAAGIGRTTVQGSHQAKLRDPIQKITKAEKEAGAWFKW
jgi:hypothetical protein